MAVCIAPLSTIRCMESIYSANKGPDQSMAACMQARSTLQLMIWARPFPHDPPQQFSSIC